MSNGTRPNLDRMAAQRAQDIIDLLVDKDKDGNLRMDAKEKKTAASAADNTVTKALGVLQEDGVYASFLYLLAKEGENGRTVVAEMLTLLAGLGFDWGMPASYDAKDVLPHVCDKVTVNLERLMLAKETLEQMLVYARYGAKARG